MLAPDLATSLDALFDAALVGEDWPVALDGLAASMGAVGAAIVPREAERQALGFPTGHAVAEVMKAYIDEEWYLNDLRGIRGWPLMARQTVIVEQELSTEDERRRLPYYQELFGRFGLPWWFGIGFRVDGHEWCMTVLGGSGQGAFDPRETERFAGLASHLRRVVKLATSFRAALDARALDAEAAAGRAVVTLDQTGAVLDMTPAAARLIGTELRIVLGRLRASGLADAALQAGVPAASTARSPSRHRLPPVAIPRLGRRPLVVDCVALPTAARDVFARATALAVLTDLEQPLPVPEDRLMQVFGLTAGEARLAALVGAGVELRAAAQTLCIARETARTVLKRIFDKVGVSRQAELAALVGRMA